MVFIKLTFLNEENLLRYFAIAGYKYAGLRGAAWCMCGNSYGSGGEVSAEQCDTPCPLGPGTCGGLLRSSVYETTAPGGSYLGCFVDTEDRDLPLLIQVGS